MALLPNIYCKNLDCKNAREKIPIPLPYPTQPGIAHHPSVWPPGYFDIKFGCPECGLVSSYKKQDVRWFPNQQMAQGQDQTNPYIDVLYWLVEFLCGARNCNTPVSFLVLTTGGEQVDAVLDQLTNEFYKGNCKHSHAYGHRGAGPYQINQFFEFPGS